jgi:uncharacterized protein (UPF0212 family)
MAAAIIHEKRHDELFAILVYSAVPELMPDCAFKREKHFKTENMKIIKCPYCGKDFRSVDVTAKLKLMRHSRNADIQWHKSIQCRICRNIVGIIYTSA